MTETFQHPLSLHETAYNLTNASITITGPGRTGTRLLGSLLQSLEDTEYLFEPLMLYAIVPQITRLPEANWKLLYETYLVEEFLLNAMAGRFLNFNENDYSYILIPKSEEDINARLATSLSRGDALKAAPSKKIVIKIPDLTPFVPKMMSYYPDMTSIVMLRNPESVIGSLVRKETFTDEALSGPWTYPPYKQVNGLHLQSWVPDADLEKFAAMSLVERCAYYYIIAYEGLLDQDRVIVIDYDEFKFRSRPIFSALCEHIGRSFGPKTEHIIGMVKEPVKNREFSWDGVAPEIRDRIYDISDQLGRSAMFRGV